MNTTIFEKFQDVRGSFKDVKAEYDNQKNLVRHELENLLPNRGDGVTANELAEQTGLDSHTVANLLQHCRHGSKAIYKVYVLLKEDGQIDQTNKITKMHIVRTYRR